jgi:hypothetical protein
LSPFVTLPGVSCRFVLLNYFARMKASAATWAACREAYALGDTLKHAAERLGLSYQAVKKRASRQRWACPAKLPPAPVSGAELTAETWARRGELHRLRVFELVSAALAGAVPDKLTSWADIERAARIGDRAVASEKDAPLVSLCFPVAQDGPSFLELC